MNLPPPYLYGALPRLRAQPIDIQGTSVSNTETPPAWMPAFSLPVETPVATNSRPVVSGTILELTDKPDNILVDVMHAVSLPVETPVAPISSSSLLWDHPGVDR